MEADIKGALAQIETSWQAFTHKGQPMTKIEVVTVLEYALTKGYETTAELTDSEVDKILRKAAILTLDDLKAMEPDATIATGIIENSPDGIFMTNENIGRKLRWVAVRGGHWDWVIVVLWADKSEMQVKYYGDKVTSEEYIKKLVPCTDEAYRMYRF